jgi:hypothetical protein
MVLKELTKDEQLPSQFFCKEKKKVLKSTEMLFWGGGGSIILGFSLFAGVCVRARAHVCVGGGVGTQPWQKAWNEHTFLLCN